jgi:hypothetical protein
MGIGIQKTIAGIGIPASVISVRYRTKKCRTEAFYSGTGLVATSLVFFSPLPDWPDADHSGIPAVSDRKTVLFAAFFLRVQPSYQQQNLKGQSHEKECEIMIWSELRFASSF